MNDIFKSFTGKRTYLVCAGKAALGAAFALGQIDLAHFLAGYAMLDAAGAAAMRAAIAGGVK